MRGKGYVVARNAHGRPTLQHKVSADTNYTRCGVDISRWSRVWQTRPLEVILCRRCRPRPRADQ